MNNKQNILYKKDYFGFVYTWIDSTNNKTYTGSHHGSIDDGYIGSGILFKNAYKKRPNAFTRKILEYNSINEQQKTLMLEQKYLDLIDDFSKTYNLSVSACGGYTTIGYTIEEREKSNKKRSKALKGKSYEEIHGKEKAAELKKQHSKDMISFSATGKGCAKGDKNHNAKTYIVTDPQGNKYTITGNLKKWCEKNNISYYGLRDILYRKIKTTKRGSVKGWQIVISNISPENNMLIESRY